MPKHYSTEDLKARYGSSTGGNFKVIDTIGVPHPFTIGVKHVMFAADHFGGILDERTLRKIPCAHPGCTLSHKEHETALLVACYVDHRDDATLKDELLAYLHAILARCEEDGFAGFAFLDRTAAEPESDDTLAA